MRLKDQLILRKVAGQFVIVPIGKRAHEITEMVYISSSAALLWDFMKDRGFTLDDLVNETLKNYPSVTQDIVRPDVEEFVNVLKKNSILEPELGDSPAGGGRVWIRVNNDDKQ